ncbi:unnamed protein product [Effrenium voratum]|nr:unnamed protein product [Effrenium voratum]
MRRFSADGPLRLAALSSPQTVLLCFDVDAELLSGLVGFALCRTTLKEGKNTGEVWIGDPRRGSWRGDGAKTAEADRPAEEGAGDASPEADEEETTAPGGGWQRALRCAIRDFKWGDYTVEPNSQYSYTLYAVRGDEELGVQDARDQGPSTAGPGLHVAAQVQLQVDTQETDGDQVHFNRGVAGSQRFARLAMGTKEQGPRSLEQWQWLSRGLEEAMLGFINRAEEGWSLRCALYEAHYPPVMRALSAARRRGASVQIVVDWKQAAWSEDRKVWTQKGPQHLNYWALAEAGLLDSGCVIFRRKPPSAIGHNKFMVLMTPDGLPVAVWTGSTNVTAGAIFGHSNVGHVVTQRPLCEKYWAYWQRLAEDPEKKDLAAFNEKLTPLPKEDWTRLVLFSPRLRWADSLAFIAQLILRARHSVAFTAAFGISREISPALLAAGSEGIGAAIPTYLLLESQGNWQASREAVQQLQRLSNVRVAFGTHLEAAGGSRMEVTVRALPGYFLSCREDARGGAWVPEKLTGLNEHVRYVHTKILLIDMFSDQPIVVTGSGNFSRASMESNDENMILVRGDRNLSDAYTVEFFRIFEHMRFRNEVEGHLKAPCVAKDAPAMCKCGQAAAERTVKKEGPNTGRRFRCCANGPKEACKFFAWVDEESSEEPEEAPWPQRAERGFPQLERRLFSGLWRKEQPDSAPRPTVEAVASEDEECASFYSAESDMLEAMDAVGVSETAAELERPSERPSTLVPVREMAQKLLTVEPNKKGGSAEFRDLSSALVEMVRGLPDEVVQREPILDCLHEMNLKFLAKTKATWRPQLKQAMDLIG